MLALINDTGILVVVLAFVVLFGASHIPKLARNLGEAGREFRKAHEEASGDADAAGAPPSVGSRSD
jgi:TatA/E family protein of Tat protein translocase